MDKKVELKVVNISNSQAQAPAFALLLQEVNGDRQLPVIIGPAEAQAITFTLHKIKPVRPITHDLFAVMLTTFDITPTEVLIYKAQDGVFYSYIFFEKEDKTIRIDSRTSDAIAIALRFECPIYIDESILEQERISPEVQDEQNDKKKSSSDDNLASKDLQTLKKALAKAVKEENYERASLLRDEIARRQ